MKAALGTLISKRSLVGGLLLLILVGEPTIPAANGLYSPPKFIALYLMYFLLYHLFDALVVRFRLVMYQVILLTFVVYSVLITGFFHKELANFVVDPKNDIFTVLLRTQPAVFIAFGLYALNRWLPRRAAPPTPVWLAALLLAILMALFSLGGDWGPSGTMYTARTAPGQSILFVVLAGLAAVHALRTHPKPVCAPGRGLLALIALCALLGLIPSLLSLLLLMVIMTLGGLVVLAVPDLRNRAL